MVAARAAVVALPPAYQDGRWPEYAPTNRHTPRVAATPVMLRPHARASRAGVLGGAPPTAEEEERQGRDVMAMSEDLERKKRERDGRVSLRAAITESAASAKQLASSATDRFQKLKATLSGAGSKVGGSRSNALATGGSEAATLSGLVAKSWGEGDVEAPAPSITDSKVPPPAIVGVD